MALAVAEPDKPAATAWLREAFDRLGQIASSGPTPPCASHDPAVRRRRAPPGRRADRPEARPRALLAGRLVPRPRPPAPRAGPSGARAPPGPLRPRGRPDLLRAPRRTGRDLAETDLEPRSPPPRSSTRPGGPAGRGLPEAPDLTFHHPKNEARLALAAALARSPRLLGHATSRFLHLWIEGSIEGY